MQDNIRYDIDGKSMRDGIIFQSSITPLEVEAIYQKKPVAKLKRFFGTNNVQELKGVRMKFVLTIDIAMIVLSLFTKKINIILAVIYMSVMVSKDFFDLMYAIFQIKVGKSKSLGRYHAAEHMAIGAYMKYKRIPTLDEIRAESRFQETCGSRRIFKKVGTFLPISLTWLSYNFVDIKVYILEIIIAVLIAILTAKKTTVKYLQIFVTNKPTDKELIVAFEGIKALKEAEDEFKELINNNGFITDCAILMRF